MRSPPCSVDSVWPRSGCLELVPNSENPFARLMGYRFPSGSGPALHGSHAQAFCAWLGLSLREQAAAVRNYLADDPEGLHAARVAAVVAEGEDTGLLPSGVLDAERQLLLSDLTVVLRLLGGGRPGPDGHNARSRVVLELLESPRISRVSLQDFAARCAVSAGWLRKWIKRLAGASFPSLVRRARLKRASNLLRAREVRVAAAAASAGYADDHDFYRDFKKLLGVTPDGYRTHWKRTQCRHCPLAIGGAPSLAHQNE